MLECRIKLFYQQDHTSCIEDRVKYGNKSGSVNIDSDISGGRMVMVTDSHLRCFLCKKEILMKSVR